MLAAFHRFLLFHDDSKLFVFGYVAAAVVLALWLGLFWLAVVVLLHLLFEMVKQHHYDPRPLPVLTRSLWELKLDLGLVLFGIVIGLYMGVIIGAAGIGAAGRVGVQAATRVGIWQRGLRGLLLSLDDVAMVVKARSVNQDGTVMVAGTDPLLAAPNAGPESGTGPEPDTSDSFAAHGHVPDAAPPHAGPPLPPPEPPTSGSDLWGKWIDPRWSRGDRFSIGFTVASALLILATPLLTNHTVASAWAAILHELRPF
jgi:hypothetical protein